MTLDDYQQAALKTALPAAGLTYCVLGLTNEAGEVAGKLKKRLRGDSKAGTAEGMAAELGDVLWYLAVCADRLGFTLDEIAVTNIAKLADRAERGVLQGDGDRR